MLFGVIDMALLKSLRYVPPVQEFYIAEPENDAAHGGGDIVDEVLDHVLSQIGFGVLRQRFSISISQHREEVVPVGPSASGCQAHARGNSCGLVPQSLVAHPQAGHLSPQFPVAL